MSAKRYLALDIGGSKIEAGVVTGQGSVLNTQRQPARPWCSRDDLEADIDAALGGFLGEPAEGLGVGFPGLLHPSTGVIARPSRSVFPDLEGFHLREHIEKEYGLPAKLDNDANMYALGVHRFGEAQPYSNAAVLTLGTNLGVGIIQGGHLERGPLAMAEGARKLLDAWHGWLRHNGPNISGLYGADGETLFHRAGHGDPTALAAFQSVGRDIGMTVTKICQIYCLEAVVLGGGVAKSFQFFERGLREKLMSDGVHVAVHRTELPYPALAGAAAMFGT